MKNSKLPVVEETHPRDDAAKLGLCVPTHTSSCVWTSSPWGRQGADGAAENARRTTVTVQTVVVGDAELGCHSPSLGPRDGDTGLDTSLPITWVHGTETLAWDRSPLVNSHGQG